jgi:hypothetical protein
MAVCRRRALQLHEEWRPPGRSPSLCLLHGLRQLTGHDGEERRPRLLLLWTYKDGAGEFLDGAKNYKLHIPAKVPAKDFWSVLVYDSLSRSELQNGQQFPSVSLYCGPKINADGSVDVYFGPKMRSGEELNSDRARQRLVPDLPLLRPAGTAFRQDVGAHDIEQVK